MKTNVPRIAPDTIVPTDNTEWNNEIALNAMKRYVIPNKFNKLDKYFIPWIVDDHSQVKGLIGYNDDNFDAINKAALEKLLELDINEIVKLAEVVFVGENEKDVITDTEIIESIQQELDVLLSQRDKLMFDEDKNITNDYMLRLQKLVEQKETRQVITLKEVLQNQGSRFYTSIDISDEDMGGLIGEYGFIRTLFGKLDEKGKSTDNVKSTMDKVINLIDKKTSKENIPEGKIRLSVKDKIDTNIASQHFIDKTIEYLKRNMPSGGDFISWLSETRTPKEVAKESKVLGWTKIMGINLDFYEVKPPKIKLTVGEVNLIQERGINLGVNTEGAESNEEFEIDTKDYSKEDYTDILLSISQEKALEILKDGLQKYLKVDPKKPVVDPIITNEISRLVEELNVKGETRRREGGEIVTQDIYLTTLPAFKRGIESVKFKKLKDKTNPDSTAKNINITSNRRGTEIKGSIPFFDYNLIPEWRIGDSYTTDKPQRKRTLKFKEEFVFKEKGEDAEKNALRELAETNAARGDFRNVSKYLNIRKRLKENTLRRNLENRVKSRFEEFKEAYDDFTELVKQNKWKDSFKEVVDMEDVKIINDYDVDDFIDLFIEMHKEGEHIDKITKMKDTLEIIDNFFDNWNKKQKEILSRADKGRMTENPDPDKEAGIVIQDIEDTEVEMTRDQYDFLIVGEEDQEVIDAFSGLKIAIRAQLDDWVPPADSNLLKESIERLLNNMVTLGEKVNVPVNLEDYKKMVESLSTDNPEFTKLRGAIRDKFEEIDIAGAFSKEVNENDIKDMLIKYGLYEKLAEMTANTDMADPRNQGEVSIDYKLIFENIGIGLELSITYVVTGINRLTVSSHASPYTVVRTKGAAAQGTTNIPVTGSKRIKTGKTQNPKRKEFYNNLKQRLINLNRSV